MSLYSKLKELCLCPSVSGREGKVRELIRKKIEAYVDSVSVDTLGNLIAQKKGRGDKKIMLCAHMDEIGFLVNFIDDNGLVRVATLGGIHCADYSFGKVVSENGVVGVFVPEAKVKSEDYKPDRMYIDIGATSKKEAEKRVRIGDFFVAEPSLSRLCENKVAGRPLDDRIGCLVLLELAERLSKVETEYSVYFVFSVQEEVGCRGSKTATYAIAPDESLCFDVTLTGDVPGASPMACFLGKGAAIKIKDSSVICSEEMVAMLSGVAKNNKIKVQKEILTGGGTDTSSMQLVGAGSMAGAISIPTRYVHSGVEMCDMSDVKACIDLAEQYILTRG